MEEVELKPGQSYAMPKAWQPQAVEEDMYRTWEEAGLFIADADSQRPRFSIVMPPPNITGELHMGHAEYTLQDLYCRYKRMRGFEVLWLPGLDHAAIATQNQLEKQLAREGTSKEQLGRAAFDRRVQQWYADYGSVIDKQLRRLGFSADWSRQRFTMDPEYVRAVREAFVRLYEEGLIYRGPRIVNWCPRNKSSISDLEVDWRETEDTLYYVRYEMADGDGAITVATVRPETMLADVAIAVSAEDERYRQFHGRTALLPLVGRELPVITDSFVDPDFGTGALKVTPGHDPNDFDIGQRHQLPVISCIDKDGNIVNEEWVPDELRTLSAGTARGRIVELLRQTDHLVRTEAYVHDVGHCDRCGEVIEPLVDEQWWCAMGVLAKPAIAAVENGQIRFVPERWTRVYLDWMYRLRDWNISRQLWLGHRIPIYYCGNHSELGTEFQFASVESAERCPQCGSSTLRQESDVLDTWFSSALWPFATMGWPQSGADFTAFHPTDVLDTARDIIFLWVARMIMTDLKFTGQVPFKTVLIHATIQDAEGRRMSKSLGTGVDPLEIIHRYGADAVRAWCIEVGVGRQDVRFDEDRVKAFQFFGNKYWNCARLVLGAIDRVDLGRVPDAHGAGNPFDRWILLRLHELEADVTAALEEFRPGDAIRQLYDFTWSEFADWYLEAAKPRFRLESLAPPRQEAAACAFHVLDIITRMLHPFMPFVTEAVWQRLPGGRDSLIARRAEPLWPEPEHAFADSHLKGSMATLFDVIRLLRDASIDAGVKKGEKPIVQVRRVAADPAGELLDSEVGREAIARLGQVEIANGQPAASLKTFVAGGLEIRLARREATGAVIDRGNISQEIEKTEREIATLERQLGDERFVSRAPESVVSRQRDRLEAARRRLDALREAAGGHA